MAQKTIEKNDPAKPGMRIGENWLLMSLFRASISSAQATASMMEKLRAACGGTDAMGRYGATKMGRLLELAGKDKFSASYTTTALSKYSKDGLFDIDEHMSFLYAYSKGQLSSYVPMLVKKFRSMGFLQDEKDSMEYMLKTGLKKESRACAYAITEVLACIYNLKAGKADYREVIRNGKETMDAW